MYKNTRNNYNKLSKEKREIYHKFLSNILSLPEEEEVMDTSVANDVITIIKIIIQSL